MRRVIRSGLAVLLCCAFALPAFAETAPALGDGPLKVGAPVTAKKKVDIAKLGKAPEKFVGKTILLEGVVKEVCQGRGCWVEVANPKGASFMARSLDETVLLPKDCKGRRVVVQGVVSAMPAKTHEHSEEAGHSCPQPQYVVATQGIELAPASASAR